MRKSLVIAAVCVAVGLPAFATTTNQRVLILGVTRKDTHRWDLSVLEVWGSKLSMDRPSMLKVEGDPAVFLDGRKSAPEEAFKPGHTFRQQGDAGYYECYSTDFRFPKAKAVGKRDGVYQLCLKDAGKARVKDRKGDVADLAYDVYLHLEVSDGAIVAIGASGLFLKNNSIPSLPVDGSGLSLEGERLHGRVVVTFLSRGTRRPADGVGRLPRTYALDVTLGEGRISGSYSTASGGETAGGQVNGQRDRIPQRGGDCTLWFGYQAPLGLAGRDENAPTGGSVSLRMKDGAFVDGLHSAVKGYASGVVTASTLKIDGNRIEGELTCSDHGNEGRIRISGVLVGHSIFGECRTAGGAGRIRGGIRTFECPPFMCWPEKAVKNWLKEHPDQPVPHELAMPEP